MTENARLLSAVAGLAVLAAAGPVSAACSGAGVVTRIEGRPQDVTILREGAPVAKPRVLEVVCHGDVVRASGATRAVLSIDGRGKVTVAGGAPFTVPARSGAPSVAGNAYRSVSDKVVPDMKRLPWDVRLKGSGTGFEFALPALASGEQKLRAGHRDVLVRLAGGEGPFQVELRSETGAVAAQARSAEPDVLLRSAHLTPGIYKLKASDSAANVVEARVAVVGDAPPTDAAYAGLPDAEVRAAVTALELAKAHPRTWAFEAQQLLAGTPAEGLDRNRIYELLESYDADGAGAAGG